MPSRVLELAVTRHVLLVLTLLTPLAARAAAAQVVTLPTVRANSLADEQRLSLIVASMRGSRSFNPSDPCSTALLDWVTLGSLSSSQLDAYYQVVRDSLKARGDAAISSLSSYRPDSTVERLHLGAVARLYRCKDTFASEAIDNDGFRPRTVKLKDIDLYVQRAHITSAPNDPELARVDSLASIARQIVIRRKTQRVWFPITNRGQAMEFWRQTGFSTLNVAAISLSSEKGAAYTELASPILHAVRLSVNAVIAGGKSESDSLTPSSAPTGTEKETVNRFLTGGGVINVSAAWPFMHLGKQNQAFDVTAILAPRFGGTLPAVGSVARDTSVVADVGVELHMKSIDLTDGVGVFMQSRLSRVSGSRKFYELVGEPGSSGFAYATLGGGLLLGGRYLVMAQRVLAGPSALQSLGWQVSVTAFRSATNPGSGGP